MAHKKKARKALEEQDQQQQTSNNYTNNNPDGQTAWHWGEQEEGEKAKRAAIEDVGLWADYGKVKEEELFDFEVATIRH